MRRSLAALAVLALAPACGDDSGGGNDAPLLDCSVMQSSSSCWTQILDSVAACAPSKKFQGVYSGDRASCVYDNGVEVEFTGAVPEDPFAPGTEFNWSFRMTVAGDTCVDWQEGTVNGRVVQQITTRSGLVRYESSSSEASLTCHDGTRYVTKDPASMLKCAPSRVLGGTAEATSLALGILGQDGDVHAFTCGLPP